MRHVITILAILTICGAVYAEQAERYEDFEHAEKSLRLRHQQLELQQREMELKFQQKEQELELREREIELNAQEMEHELEMQEREMELEDADDFEESRQPWKKPHYQHGRLARGHMLLCPLFMLITLVVHILLSAWVFKDIRSRNAGSGIWIAIALITGLLGTAVYALTRIGDSALQADTQ